MSIYDESHGSRLARLTRVLLAADPDLAAFFGSRISECDAAELDGAVKTPSLRIITDVTTPKRLLSGRSACVTPLAVLALLPRPTPAVAWVAVPTVPTAAGASGGTLNGAYRYRLTRGTEDGESFASSHVTVSPSTQKVTLTFSAPGAGSVYRVWRTDAGKLAYRWIATVCEDTATTWVDDGTAIPGDELAPIRRFPEDLGEYIAQVLYTGEALEEGGQVVSDPALLVRRQRPRLVTRQNVLVVGVTGDIPDTIDEKTGASE